MRTEIRVLAVEGVGGAEPVAAALGRTSLDPPVSAAASVDDSLAALEGVDAVVAATGGIDVVELLERVGERAPGLPVVVLTDDPEVVAAAAEAGATDCRSPTDGAGWELLGRRLVDAVERAAAERRDRALRDLHGATRRLLTAEDRATVAAVVTEAACEILDLPVSGVRYAAGGQLVPVEMTEARAELLGAAPPYDVEGPAPPAVAYRTGETVVLSEEEAAADGRDRAPLSDAAYVPLGDHGTLSVATTAATGLSSADRNLVETLAANAEAVLDALAEHERVRERETALARERDKHAALFENSQDAIVYCVFDGEAPIVESVNPAFEDVFGWSAEAVRGRDVDELLVPDEAFEAARSISRDTRAGARQDNTVERLTAAGRRQFLLRTVPVDVGGERAAYCLYVDVTERRQRQQRLAVLNRVLRHDLRNDMNVLLGSTEELAELVDDPDAREHVATIRRTGRTLLERSAQARLLQESLADDDGPVDLAAAARAAAARFRSSTPDATLETRLPETALVHGGGAMATVVGELLANAAEHAGPAPAVELAVEPAGDDGRVRLSVTDDGPGVPDHELAALDAGPETQLEHTSGLGLWLARWTVEDAGGTLRFEAPDGGGTRAVVTLPAARPTAAGERAARTGDDGGRD